MTLSLPDLTSLNADNVRNKLTTLAALIDDLGIGVDTSRGVFRDLVLRYQAIMQEASDELVQSILTSSVPSLALVSTDPLDSEVVEAVAASYGVTRVAASTASGAVLLVFSSSKTVFIPVGTEFSTSDGRKFVTTTGFALKSGTSALTQSIERRLAVRSDGKYQATIELSSVDASAASNLQAGDALTPGITLPDFVSATASTDFYGGTDAESLRSLITRVKNTVPAKSMSSRSSIFSFLTANGLFPNISDISVIGAGDLEMTRDRRSMFPGGNKVDVYVRTSVFPVSKQVTLSATVSEVISGGLATWSCHVDRDQLPGFYRIGNMVFENTAINQPSNLSIEIGKDTSPIYGEQSPAIYATSEVIFSRYQTANVTFNTPSESYSVGDSANVVVTLEGMPDIDKIQSVVSSRSHRFATGDSLVRAAFPCYVSPVIKVHIRAGLTAIDPSVIKNDIANYINQSGFAGEIYAAAIASRAQGYLPTGSNVASVDLLGEYVQPDGIVDRVRVSDVLPAQHKYHQNMSNRTTIFVTNAAAVTVLLYEQQLPKLV